MKEFLVSSAAIIAAIGFVGLSIFQLMLVFGLPYGEGAWGGKYKVLPLKFRLGSFIAILIFIFATFCVLEAGDVIYFINDPSFVKTSLWIFAGYLGLNTLGNFVSNSKIENKIMAPISLVLGICCFIVAALS